MKSTGIVMVGLAVGVVAAATTYGIIRNMQGTSAAATEEEFLEAVRSDAAAAPSTEVKTAPLSPSTSSEKLVPQIEAETTHYQMGIISNDELTKGQVMIHNRGKAALLVPKVNTQCGCTTGKMSKEMIPPGESAPLEVTVDPMRINGFKSTKTLTLFTNDPKHPTLAIQVSAEVEPEFVLEPPTLDFGTITKGEPATQTLKVIQKTDQPFELTEAAIVGNESYFQFTYEEIPAAERMDPNKKEYVAKVTVLQTAPTGPLRASLRLKTNLKRLPMSVAPVFAEVKGIYTVHPPVVTLRSVEPGQTVPGVITIESQVPIELAELQAPNQSLKVTPRPGEQPNSIVFDVTVAEELDQRWQRDTWTLKLRANDQEFIEEVKVMAIISPAAGETGNMNVQLPEAQAPAVQTPGAPAEPQTSATIPNN